MVIAGLILAGGEGRRMGRRDKALLPLSGRPLVDHVRDRLAPQVVALALSANGDPGRFARTGAGDLPVLADSQPRGPLSGVRAGLAWAGAGGAGQGARPGQAARPITHLLTAPVDAPFLPADLAARLWGAGGGALAMASAAGRLHPTFALWPVGLLAEVEAFLAEGENPRLLTLLDRLGACAAPFPDEGAFANLNTPDDLAAAAAAAAAAGPGDAPAGGRE
jgi:molybdopterin-guanine dinucleotide biosynthesis protein A